MKSYLFLILAFALNATANVFLKVKAQQGLTLSGSVWNIISSNALLIIGLLLFAVNVLFYFLALRTVPLSIAYPIMTIASLIIINVCAVVWLKEQVSAMQLVGYVFLLIGILLVYNPFRN